MSKPRVVSRLLPGAAVPLLTLLALCGAESGQAAAPQVTGFGASPAPSAAGAAVHFTWTTSDADGDALTCSFDPTGVGPVIVIANCTGAQQLDHTYAWPGTYQPRIIVADASTSDMADRTHRVTGTSTLTMIRPTAGARVGSALPIAVTLDTEFDIREIVARVADATLPLVYSTTGGCPPPGCAPAFIGTMDLTALAAGPHVLEVRMEDVTDAEAYFYQRIVLDDPPQLTISEPLIDTVARPTIDIDAQCADDLPPGCTISVLVGCPDGATSPPACTPTTSSTSSLATTFDLSAYDGSRVNVRFVAVDSSNQKVIVNRPVYVESSSRLVELERTQGTILDVAPDRLLYVLGAPGGDRMFLFDRAADGVQEIVLPSGSTVYREAAFLSPNGAIFVLDLDANTAHAHEFDGVQLIDLGPVNSRSSLEVAGGYAIWSNGTALYRRDLQLGQTVPVSNSAGNWRHSVAASGVVTYWTSTYDIARFDGTTTLLAEDALDWFTYVASDGNLAAYRRATPCCSDGTWSTVLHTGSGEVVLRDAGEYEPIDGRDFDVRDGWVAFTRQGNIGQQHVWTYAPDAQLLQRTFFSRSFGIDRLGSDGAVMLVDATHRWFSESDGDLSVVNSKLGRPYSWTNGWELRIGRSLFAVAATAVVFDDGFE